MHQRPSATRRDATKSLADLIRPCKLTRRQNGCLQWKGLQAFA